MKSFGLLTATRSCPKGTTTDSSRDLYRHSDDNLSSKICGLLFVFVYHNFSALKLHICLSECEKVDFYGLFFSVTENGCALQSRAR